MRARVHQNLVVDPRHPADLRQPAGARFLRIGRDRPGERRHGAVDRDVDVRLLERRIRLDLLFDLLVERLVGRHDGARSRRVLRCVSVGHGHEGRDRKCADD